MRKPIKLHFLAVATIIFLLQNLCIAIGNLSSDAQALLQFASWVPHIRKLNWNSTIPICTSWVGISCNGEGTRVIAIHLPGYGLSGPIPQNSIGKVDALRTLNLRSNYLNGTLPVDIPLIPSVQFLYLQNNNFSGNIPQALTNLTGLTSLNLQFNSFTGLIPELNLTRLRVLNVSHNALNGTIPSSLQNFPVSSFSGNYFLCGTPLTPCSFLASENTHSKKNDQKLGIGLILAIAIGGMAFIVLLAMCVVLFIERAKK